MNNIPLRFYRDRLGNEQFIYETTSDMLMAIPDVNDIIELPIYDNNEDCSFDTDCYVIKQRYVSPNSIDYFCDFYNWEA